MSIRSLSARADKYATIIVNKNCYSVFTRLVGQCLRVIGRIDHIEILAQSGRVACLRRLLTKNQSQLEPIKNGVFQAATACLPLRTANPKLEKALATADVPVPGVLLQSSRRKPVDQGHHLGAAVVSRP